MFCVSLLTVTNHYLISAISSLKLSKLKYLNLTIHFNLLSYFYSYKCDDYVSNDTEHQVIDKIRQSIMQNRRDSNGENGNGTAEQSDENSKESSEGNVSVSNSSTNLHDQPQLSPNNDSDEARIADVTSDGTSDTSSMHMNIESCENKPSKSTRVTV